MQRVAVLVDAGYLFAQGSTAITGSSKPRQQIQLDEVKAVEALIQHSCEQASGCSVLRVYWYDGVSARGPSEDHERIASCKDVKLRLGFINSSGRQKGVDSLIVTDLIELARNKAITDAVLVSGDEDLRIGVQIAQSHGIRVHLLGIEPARGSQSKTLRQEADTISEWPKGIVETFMTVTPGLSATGSVSASGSLSITPSRVSVPPLLAGAPRPTIRQCSTEFAAALSAADASMVLAHSDKYGQVPSIVDRKLLASSGDRIARDLDKTEKIEMRSVFMEALRHTATK